MNFTKEQIAKAAECKSVEELIDLAKEEAEKYFAQLSNKALNLEEIENVAGGCIENVCIGNASAAC